jgi:hypothetical protein
MSYTIGHVSDERPDEPIYPTVEAALMAAFEQSERMGAPVLVVYDHLSGDPLLLVWCGRAYWP